MKRFVVIGGGTGSHAVLRGLKRYPLDLTAVVSMFDSGGSTGMLRDEFGILPPGDVRRCLVALAEENAPRGNGRRGGPNILRELFNYRFSEESSLKGHSIGNLFLTALTQILGNEALAIREAGKVLNIKGRVLPVSLTNAHLHAELEDGTVIRGETNIDIPKHDGSKRIRRAFLEPAAFAFEETEAAIRNADAIIIGPGDLYTSIIPNLLVKGIPEAIRESRATKIFVCNVMTKWGETNGFKASDFAREALFYSGLDAFDYVICSSTPLSLPTLRRYSEEKSFPVICDPLLGNFARRVVREDVALASDIIRHDSEKLASVIIAQCHENAYLGFGRNALERDRPVG
ncbi:MAG TPA: gluconeogenesis factor YvcK family protein [Candidatus Paceibacterota bacterium]|nr:gluconeogenesis factor YvcK family protein [Candidatus Paceibacterota bacterium]